LRRPEHSTIQIHLNQMKPKLFTPALLSALALIGTATANAGITIYAEYHLGEPLSLGTDDIPLDSVGGKDFGFSINPGPVFVGGPGVAPGSTAFLDTSHPADSGYYNIGNFSDLATNNVAIGVFAKASGIAGNIGTIFGTGDGGGFDLSLHGNGWAGSLFNVAWVGPADGVSGSFTPDTWVHLALIRADGLTTFYIDGVPQGAPLAIAPAHSSPHISVKPGGSAYFDGGIDEARVVTFDSGESTAAVIGALQGVPEPSSLALLGIGCLTAIRRSRKK
jgi:Concanavalin A-like lectin/glucanases superfamily/PEP-CTERM motif